MEVVLLRLIFRCRGMIICTMESQTVKLVKPSPNTLRRVMPRFMYLSYLGCKDLGNSLKVSGALLTHSRAHARASNIVQDLEYMSFNICR